MHFSTSRLEVSIGDEATDIHTSTTIPRITQALSGAYLAWIESARHGPFAHKADEALKQKIDLPSTGFISNTAARVKIALLDDPHTPKIITPKVNDQGVLQWWLPPSDEPDPTKMQAKREKNAEILDEGLLSKDPSRLFWMRFDFPNQFLEADLREHELNAWRLYSSPFKNGSWFMQAIEELYGLEHFTFQAFHTLEGNVLWKEQFFARINPAFVPPFSYYEIILCYLPEELDSNNFVLGLAALADHELSEGAQQRRAHPELQSGMQRERDEMIHGPLQLRNILRQKQTELQALAPASEAYHLLEQECKFLQEQIEAEKDKRCYYLPSLLAIE